MLSVKRYLWRWMCGIAGILRFPEDELEPDTVVRENALQHLHHRGPDARRILRRQNATLFHTRLQIVDTSDASAQPFFYEGNNDALVYNGEVFNFRELGKKFSDLRTSGDVEVLYRLIREEGPGALHKVNGFFAFAYLGEDGSLLLARDRFGEKPLYYYSDEHRFVFASEMKTLLDLAGAQELNYNQVYSYFRLNYCAGKETILRNVFRLMPGEMLELKQGRTTIRQWYSVEKKEPSGDLYKLLDDAVKIRLHADVPVGSFLSGGLDSSIVSALAVKHAPGLRTFNIGFSDEKFLDESGYAKMVSEHIGSEHHTFRLSEDDFLANIDDFLNTIDEPFADSSAFNMYMLCKLSRQHIKVALSGDGADEFFKGYNKHRAFMISGRMGGGVAASLFARMLAGVGKSRSGALSNKKRQAHKFALLSKLPHEDRLKFLASVSTHAECAGLLAEGVSSFYFDSLFRGNELLPDFPAEDQFDVGYLLPDDMLVKADRFSMRNGLEIRSPFLDPRVAEYALNLPLSRKTNITKQKIILRKTFSHLLPREITTRGKKGFELPLERWMKNALKDRLESDWLNEKDIEAENVFSLERVKALKNELYGTSAGDAPAKIWALIVFRQWMNNYRDYILPRAKKE